MDKRAVRKLAQRIADATGCYVARNKPPMIIRWNLFHTKPYLSENGWCTDGNGYTPRFFGFEIKSLGYSDDGREVEQSIYKPNRGIGRL